MPLRPLGFVRSIGLTLAIVSPVRPQVPTQPASRLLRERVHSQALEGNLLGDPADQEVAVYLPPGYASASRRYPVLYLLHGIGGSPDDWIGPGYQGMEVAVTMDRLIGAGTIQPMIVVMPNATNRYIGTYYTNSAVSGGWEDWVWRDLVSHIDATYRTIRRPESRGVAGHSMGGFGALRMGMRHEDVFSVVWAMNPCCLAMIEEIGPMNRAYEQALDLKSLADVDAAIERGDFYPVAILALSAASPHDPTGGSG